MTSLGLEVESAIDNKVIEISVPPNRVDCLSVQGISREIAVKRNLESKPLEFIPFTEEQAERSNSDFYSDFVTPNEAQYEKGAFPRYFVKDGRTGKIIEVDQDKYNTQKKENKLYRRVLRIEWYITGNPEDEIINGYLYPGTKAKNQDVINQAEKILPGIGEQILKDPGQFVRK